MDELIPRFSACLLSCAPCFVSCYRQLRVALCIHVPGVNKRLNGFQIRLNLFVVMRDVSISCVLANTRCTKDLKSKCVVVDTVQEAKKIKYVNRLMIFPLNYERQKKEVYAKTSRKT